MLHFSVSYLQPTHLLWVIFHIHWLCKVQLPESLKCAATYCWSNVYAGYNVLHNHKTIFYTFAEENCPKATTEKVSQQGSIIKKQTKKKQSVLFYIMVEG